MPDLPVDVVRSSRRTKTVQARVIDGRLRISIPDRFSASEERDWVARMAEQARRRLAAGEVDLGSRAAVLAEHHDLPLPASITWSQRQNTRWGSCTPADGSIRISSRLATMPGWVLDYVIVHELAHLAVDGHGPAFNDLVDRYPLAERARGYLIARSELPAS